MNVSELTIEDKDIESQLPHQRIRMMITKIRPMNDLMRTQGNGLHNIMNPPQPSHLNILKGTSGSGCSHIG